MPLKQFMPGAPIGPARHPNGASVQLIVVLAVVEVLLEPAADTESKVGRDGHVSAIVEGMHVGAEQEPIANAMWTVLGNRLDMHSLEDGQGLLSRHRTPALIRIGHEHAESPLPQSLPHRDDSPLNGTLRFSTS